VAPTSRRCCLPAPGQRAFTHSRRCGPRLPSTPGSSRLTCPVSAHPNVETTFYLHEQWASSWPQLIAEVDLVRPHIVGPDIGTAAALFAAAAHPERMASVIVGTGGAAVPIQLGEPLASWVLDPDLEKYRRMDARVIVGAAVDKISGGVPDEIRADYVACYDGDRFAESMQCVRRYPEELPVLAQLLPQITTPVTIINGRNDPVVPLINAEFLDERLPNSRLAIVDAGHFVWEEAPTEYASIILDSITQ
jgi:pimeloyl-ACP methyl ester carboxylesterase